MRTLAALLAVGVFFGSPRADAQIPMASASPAASPKHHRHSKKESATNESAATAPARTAIPAAIPTTRHSKVLASPTPPEVSAPPASATPAPPPDSATAANPNGRVWVNTKTHVYHKSGSRWYGKTKEGKYLSESDAIKEGDKAAKGEKP